MPGAGALAPPELTGWPPASSAWPPASTAGPAPGAAPLPLPGAVDAVEPGSPGNAELFGDPGALTVLAPLCEVCLAVVEHALATTTSTAVPTSHFRLSMAASFTRGHPQLRARTVGTRRTKSVVGSDENLCGVLCDATIVAGWLLAARHATRQGEAHRAPP